MQFMRKKIILCSIVFALCLPFISSAHGIATSKQAIVDQYLLEFEYEALEQIPSQEPVGYTIRLLENKTQEDIPFDYAFVWIQKDGRTVFNGHVAQAPDTVGIGRFVTALPDPGNYVANISFLKGGKTIAASKFDFGSLSVRNDAGLEAGQPLSKPRQVALLVTALAIGVILGLLLSTFLEKKN